MRFNAAFSLYLSGFVATLLVSSTSFAQSTISDRPLELNFSTGLWGALLPSYDLGTTASNSPAIHDDLDNVGAISELNVVRRFLGTRTSLESKAFFASAVSDADADPSLLSIPNPGTGAAASIAGAGTSLDSQVDHYGFDIALRDTWQTRFGGLSAGLGFSTMAFDQDFDIHRNGTRLLSEGLNSDFVGGKGFVGWDGRLLGRDTNIDLTYGLYDLDADYSFIGGTIPGSRNVHLQETATTGEISVTRHRNFRGIAVAFTVAAMYITDMPTIQHNIGSAATLTTTDAGTISAMFQILL